MNPSPSFSQIFLQKNSSLVVPSDSRRALRVLQLLIEKKKSARDRSRENRARWNSRSEKRRRARGGKLRARVFVSRVSGDSPKFFCAANALVCVFFSSLSFFFQFFSHTRALPHKESRSFPSLSLCLSLSLSVSGLSEPNPTQIKEEEEEEDHNVRSRGIASRSANGKNLPKNAPRARTALLDVPGDDRESDEGAREFARRGGETQGELVRIRTHEEGETDETDGRVVVARGAQRRGGDDESV